MNHPVLPGIQTPAAWPFTVTAPVFTSPGQAERLQPGAQAQLRGAAPAAQALAAQTNALLQAALTRLRALLLLGGAGGRVSTAPGPGPDLGLQDPGAALALTLQGLADLAWERREFLGALRLYAQARACSAGAGPALSSAWPRGRSRDDAARLRLHDSLHVYCSGKRSAMQ